MDKEFTNKVLSELISQEWLWKQSMDVIDNIRTIDNMLTFKSDDEFYMLQVLKRRKENPDMKGDSLPLRTVYLHRKGQLTEISKDLVELAEKERARIYLNPNVKSSKKSLLHCIAEMARRAATEDYYKPYKIFDSVVGQMGACRDNRWIIDVDNEYMEMYMETDELTEIHVRDFIRHLLDTLDSCEPDTNKYVTNVITRNGIHVITKSFNPVKFGNVFPKLDVHKNNPTLVYCPSIKKIGELYT